MGGAFINVLKANQESKFQYQEFGQVCSILDADARGDNHLASHGDGSQASGGKKLDLENPDAEDASWGKMKVRWFIYV